MDVRIKVKRPKKLISISRWWGKNIFCFFHYFSLTAQIRFRRFCLLCALRFSGTMNNLLRAFRVFGTQQDGKFRQGMSWVRGMCVASEGQRAWNVFKMFKDMHNNTQGPEVARLTRDLTQTIVWTSRLYENWKSESEHYKQLCLVNQTIEFLSLSFSFFYRHGVIMWLHRTVVLFWFFHVQRATSRHLSTANFPRHAQSVEANHLGVKLGAWARLALLSPAHFIKHCESELIFLLDSGRCLLINWNCR